MYKEGSETERQGRVGGWDKEVLGHGYIEQMPEVYIGHLRKVLPKVIKREGGPTGY